MKMVYKQDKLIRALQVIGYNISSACHVSKFNALLSCYFGVLIFQSVSKWQCEKKISAKKPILIL